MLGIAILLLAIFIITFNYLHNAEGIRVDFGNIGNYHGKRVTIEGILGENVSLQQFIQDDSLDNSNYRYYSFYPSKESSKEKIILVFENYDFNYFDQGAFIRITGKVDVSNSGEVYLRVIKIN